MGSRSRRPMTKQERWTAWAVAVVMLALAWAVGLWAFGWRYVVGGVSLAVCLGWAKNAAKMAVAGTMPEDR